MVKGTGNATVYDVLVALHVAAALVGFGAVGLSGIYSLSARRPERPGAVEETARFYAKPGWAQYALLAVPAIGAGAIAVRPAGRDFGDVWVVAGLTIWALAALVLLAVVRPAEAAIRAALATPAATANAGPAAAPNAVPVAGPAAAPVAAPIDGGPAACASGPVSGAPRRAATRVAWGAAVCDVLFVVALGFMVTQPR